jgi:hypothetical protein
MAAPSTTNIRAFATKRLPTQGLIITGVAPSTVSGSGAGTGAATLSPDGRDMAGTITVTPAGAPAAGGIVCTLSFGNRFKNLPKGVSLQPMNAATAALTAANQVFPDAITRDGFSIRAGANALPVGATLAWFYNVVG